MAESSYLQQASSGLPLPANTPSGAPLPSGQEKSPHVDAALDKFAGASRDAAGAGASTDSVTDREDIDSSVKGQTPGMADSEYFGTNTEVLAVGDSNGEYETFIWNMTRAGAIDGSGNWIADNRIVIVDGDILADRGTSGFDILLKIRELRTRAKVQGGNIIVIAGNHDDFMLSFLTQRQGRHVGDPISACLNYKQGLGIVELFPYSGSSDTGGKYVDKIFKIDEAGPSVILNNMRGDNTGKAILEEICRFKVCEVVGDTLFIHTDPTNEIFSLILDYGIVKLNDMFTTALRDTLLLDRSFDRDGCNFIFDTFLHTGNRTFVRGNTGSLDISLLTRIKQAGINRVVFGHSDLGHGHRKQEIGGILFINIDQSARKNGDVESVNAARIKPESTETASEFF